MASEWRLRRLDELGFVGRGKSRHRPRNDERLYGGPYPFVQTADIMAADPYITNYSQTYSEFGLQQSKMWGPNTLCMTIAGANTARTAILKIQACFPDSVVGFVADKTKADLHFVKYSLDLMKSKFLAVSRGATQDNLSLDKLLSFPLRVPDLAIQQRIGAVLSAYDDLMENSARRIKILEQMAQMLYREWFVNFRFPDKEKATRTASENGMIPAGWKVSRMDEVAEVIDCLHSKKPQHMDNGTRLLLQLFNIGESGELDLSKKFLIDDSTYKLWTSRIEVRSGDCVVTNVGRIAAVAQIPEQVHAALGRNMTAIRPRKIKPTFLIEYLLSPLMTTEVAKKKDAGAIMDSLNVKGIVRLSVPVPPSSLMNRFEEIARPMRRETEVLVQKNLNLRATRDLLLPKLVSGEISVEKFETEAAAQTV
ncbi:MAG: restriction endonuclease subunit S [Acidobacteria bacterium]|nr:MAG: restriction endonuclease subunit S [Acidobacteriota bacterium]